MDLIIFAAREEKNRAGLSTKPILLLLVLVTIFLKKNKNIYYEDCLYILLVVPVANCAGRPGSSEVPRNPLTRWDVSSTPANGIFLTKKEKKRKKMPNGWRTIKSLVHKIRLHGRRGKGMAESF